MKRIEIRGPKGHVIRVEETPDGRDYRVVRRDAKDTATLETWAARSLSGALVLAWALATGEIP